MLLQLRYAYRANIFQHRLEFKYGFKLTKLGRFLRSKPKDFFSISLLRIKSRSEEICSSLRNSTETLSLLPCEIITQNCRNVAIYFLLQITSNNNLLKRNRNRIITRLLIKERRISRHNCEIMSQLHFEEQLT